MAAALRPLHETLKRWGRRVDPGMAAIIAVFLIYFCFFTALGLYRPLFQTIHANDPVGYYAWIRSILFDGDLNFENEYRNLNKHLAPGQAQWANPNGPRTPTGHLGNCFAIGPGLLWGPFVVLVHPMAEDLGGRQDGFSQPYHMAVFLAISLYGLFGLLLTYGFLRTWYSPASSAVTTLCAWAASPALYYTYPAYAMAHSTSMFSVALFLFTWARLRQKNTSLRWLIIGLALGAAAMVRWQNGLFAIIPAMDLLSRFSGKNVLRLACCALGSLVGFAPQMFAWKIVYGAFLTIPQGPDFVQWAHPDFFAALFSRQFGLITWTPLCGIVLAGFFWAPKENRTLFWALAAACLLQVYVNACALNLGWTFGMRRMCDCVPIFALGLALLLARLGRFKKWGLAAALLFAAWNTLFVLQYGGFIDSVYIQRATDALVRQHHLDPATLSELRELPNGAPFHYQAFVYGHVFPRGGAPSFQQFVPDKCLVVRMLASRLSGCSPPT